VGDWELFNSQRDQFSPSLAAAWFSKSNQTWELSWEPCHSRNCFPSNLHPGKNHWLLTLPGLWTLCSPCSGVGEHSRIGHPGLLPGTKTGTYPLTFWRHNYQSTLIAQNCITGRLCYIKMDPRSPQLKESGANLLPCSPVLFFFG